MGGLWTSGRGVRWLSGCTGTACVLNECAERRVWAASVTSLKPTETEGIYLGVTLIDSIVIKPQTG